MVKQYPTALVVIHLLPDLGQETPDRITVATVPRRLSVEKNDLQTADSVEIELDFEDCPYDPRIIRGATVEAFMADAGTAEGSFWEDIQSDVATLRKYVLFQGVIDELSNKLDGRERTVSLKGRDYSAYLLDADLDGEVVYGTKTLVEIIRGLLDERPQTKDIEIEIRGQGIEKLKPANYIVRGNAKKVTSLKTGLEKLTTPRKHRSASNVWETILELALEGGIVAYIELDKLVLADPATLNLDDASNAREAHFTLGRDIDRYEPMRKYGRRTGIGVLVSSWDPEAGITRQASSPKGALKGVDSIPASPLGATAQTKPHRLNITLRPFVVRGIRDQSQLQAIADCIATQMTHQELDLSIESLRFTDSAGLAVQQLRYGDPVVIDINPDMPSWLAKSPEEQIGTLLSLGYPVADSQKLSNAVQQLNVPYWLNRATYEFSEEGEDNFHLTLELRSRRPIEVPGV